MKKKLVAYFSATRVTAKVANRLAEAIGADIFEIEPVQALYKRRSELAGYQISQPCGNGVRRNLMPVLRLHIGEKIWHLSIGVCRFSDLVVCGPSDRQYIFGKLRSDRKDDHSFCYIRRQRYEWR